MAQLSMRTLLVSDLVESTRMVSTLGDLRAAEILARHDALVRGLLPQHDGLEIDRSDGFLLLFSRPIDAVRHALAYHAGLLILSAETGAELAARVGVHVGEVVLRANAKDDVARGAKPLEVEGIAKHVTARVMSLAAPGQTLLSSTAADLARRTNTDDGESNWHWLEHGNYVLKGIDASVAIVEVGVAGNAPFAPPSGSEKARRERPPTNLLAQSTAFIGRPNEVAEVSKLLCESRLVTLTGTGGAGKTRLSLEVADRLLLDFADGVWFVELAAVQDPALVPDSVGRTLGLEVRGRSVATPMLAAAIAERRMLIVLDNCEHLVGACASFVETILAACPHIRFLASSREALRVAGETAWRIPSLSMPDNARTIRADELDAYDAVRLFLERARSAAPHFRVTDANAAAVVEVCVRLDGIPLALELAAARLRTLSVEELLARLRESFRILNVGNRTALPRQQTLRALIDWSFDLLDERQRTLFRRLAVFSGAFTLARAEAVVADDELDTGDVIDVLSELVERSVVVAEPHGPLTRYRLLETIRQYACERLDAAREAERFRLRHRDEYLQWVEALRTRYADTPSDTVWFGALAEEHDNVREAIHTALERDLAMIAKRDAAHEPVAHRFVPALRRFWLVRCYFTEARALIDPILAAGAVPESARIFVLEGGTTFSQQQHDYALALAHVREGLALAKKLGLATRESYMRTQIAFIHYLQNDLEAANRFAIDALAFARENADHATLVFALNMAGMCASRVSDHERAIALLLECRDATLTVGSRQYHANVLESLATAYALCDGHYARARPLYEECLPIFTMVGDRQAQLLVCERLAWSAAASGKTREAARVLGACGLVRERMGMMREPIDELDLAPTLAAIEATLTVEDRALARAEGRALDLAGALALGVSL